ncbi:MAG: hypothetical protein K2W96_14910 [Gemmataceae bacterium]|nr:hypothetical protein [Gemmataceae bacterium]
MAYFAPRLERLEDRDCPAGVWTWESLALGGNTSWSNSDNWKHNGDPAQAGSYPGKNVGDDEVVISGALKSSVNLDVALTNPIKSLKMEGGYAQTLKLVASDLKVADDIFSMKSGTLALDTHKLEVVNSLASVWQGGWITGAAAAKMRVIGSTLNVSLSPVGLDVTLEVRKGVGDAPSSLVLGNMNNNLVLNGASNFIDVKDSVSLLALSQNVVVADRGGISLGAAHTGSKTAVVLRPRASIESNGTGQVNLAGIVENHGGFLKVFAHARLNIAATNAAGESYIQDGADSVMLVYAGGKVIGTGKFRIDQGTVEFKVSSGGTSVALECQELLFGNALNTFFKLVDTTAGTPGTVSVVGSVTLGTNTRTEMSFNTTTGTADLLRVQNGTLKLAGTLVLTGNANPAAGTTLDLFDVLSNPPDIQGGFNLITDNFGNNPTGSVVVVNPQQKKFRITW